jgi:LmbE family N-acetylglucosaminyl deacetylase
VWWRGCPSWEQAIELVRAEMQQAGLDPMSLRLREVRDEEEAEALDFAGSPTVLVDGRDIEDPGDQPRGLTCRVYRLRDGRVSPLPDRAGVREALIEATGG